MREVHISAVAATTTTRLQLDNNPFVLLKELLVRAALNQREREGARRRRRGRKGARKRLSTKGSGLLWTQAWPPPPLLLNSR